MNGRFNEWMVEWFGTSWRVTVYAYFAALSLAVETVIEAGYSWPTSVKGWLMIGVALFLALQGRQSKDRHATNAPVPGPAQLVPKIVAAPPPAAVALAAKTAKAKPAVNNP